MKETIQQVIYHLNAITGSNFEVDAIATEWLKLWMQRGYKLPDFQYVIELKATQWKGSKYEQFLRPQTLFGQKFQIYVNERPAKNNIQRIAESVEQAKRTSWKLDKK